MFRRFIFFTIGLTAGALATWKLAVEPWYRSWGSSTDDASKPLAGDDLIAEPSVVDTRAIDIAARPETVWPWLVQMGFGRAGWYSYDRIDMAGASGDAIVPEWQTLAQGDIMPTQPGGGFRADVVDPGRALVLYLDGDMVAEQAKAAQDAEVGAAPANLRATGRVMATGFPTDFSASWAFVLEPFDPGMTRLIERVRVHMGEGTPATKAAGPVMGFGVFAMMRKQMLGIRDRAERGDAASPRSSVGDGIITASAPDLSQREPVEVPA